jgi:hypothetical protein
MGRMYMVPIDFSYTTAAIDLIEINPATQNFVVIHEIMIGQSDSETSEATKAELYRGVTSGSGGATPAGQPLDPGDAAEGMTIETGNTTVSTAGTLMGTIPWNTLAGFHYLPTPEARITVVNGGIFAIRLPAATGTYTLEGFAILEEIG